ncbi:alpha/beta hydrolase [Sphingosinicella sp.]|uniref:alpha/beta hydrolase n=1 Tax=Sphingosinicella sp. TaxID=1917971 RepID=UPI004037603D
MRLLAFLALLLLAVPAAAEAEERAYGPDPRQRPDYTPAARSGAPLVIFIHGGAWSFGDKSAAAHMAPYFHNLGYAFAALNYRLVPNATVRQQAEDIAAAVARLRRDTGARLLLLMGHSAGAHLAALVATDPDYLAAHRLTPAVIDGVVLLDGAGYDVVAQMHGAGPFLRRMYRNAFGDDEDLRVRLSPISHSLAPNAGEFLILHVARRDDSREQSVGLMAALRAGGTPATVEAVDDSHSSIFRQFGTAGHRATALVGAFAARVLESRR